MADTQRFKDKIAIISGGCAGIGRGIADLLVQHGGKVALLDIDDVTGNAIKDDTYLFVHCDVSKDEQVPKAIESVVSTFGKVDLLVNNAAIQPTQKTIDELTATEFEQALNTNLVGYFRMCKFALPHLRRTKGSIVNLASIVSTIGLKGCPHYIASKLMRRFADRREIALACLYLAVDATYCTGSNLKCTGGV